MKLFLDLFSPETYEAFCNSDRTISGFRERHLKAAKRIHPGDKLICYLTKLSRWVGILEVESDCFIDNTPIFYPEQDPFIVRFKVKSEVWLNLEHTIPIYEDYVWNSLSFTKDHEKYTRGWTGRIRGSLVQFDQSDGNFLYELIRSQSDKNILYEVDEDNYKKLIDSRMIRDSGFITISIPTDEDEIESQGSTQDIKPERESIKVQSLLAKIGESMGFKIWIPKNDRARVLEYWDPGEDILLSSLPINYDTNTNTTIELIDILWLKKNYIVRAFEVEHSTSIYSGILRMADLLALQANVHIKLHIVAPDERREKVFKEIKRPIFSVFESGPLSERCSYISYNNIYELSENKQLNHLKDDVIEEYEEFGDFT